MRIIKVWFTLRDALKIRSSTDYIGFYDLINEVATSQSAGDDYKNALQSASIEMSDLLGYVEEEGDAVVDTRPLAQLLYNIKLRFSNHYIGGYLDDEVSRTEVQEIAHFLASDDAREFIERFISILCTTTPKYATIMNIYKAQENRLMDGLKSQHDGSSALDRAHSDHLVRGESKSDDYTIEAEGKNLHNATPQTTDIVATLEGDQFVNDLDKSSATTTNQGTTRVDSDDASSGEVHDRGENHESSDVNTKYVMEKIAEIQDSYSMILRKWTNEFEGLFIEEENI